MGSFNVVGGSLACVPRCACTLRPNTKLFISKLKQSRLVPVVVELVSCLVCTSSLMFLVSLFVFRHVSNTVAVKPFAHLSLIAMIL